MKTKGASVKTIAREVTLLEGKKVSLPIAQVSEVLAILGRRWRAMPSAQVFDEVRALLGKS